MPITPKHVLISRTDNIGDVILTLGLAVKLKQHFPGIRITFLARHYVKAILDHSPVVDHFLEAETLLNMPEAAAIKQLQSLEIDTIVHVFPKRHIAWLAKKAGIKHRIGTARRWYHTFTCNHRPNFSRAKSTEHEAVLNLQLLAPFGLQDTPSLRELGELITLKARPASRSPYLAVDKFNLIVHPFSNGNTREWPLTSFSQLLCTLPKEKFNILMTGSAAEHEKLQPLVAEHPFVTDLSGKLSLDALLNLISQADGLIANSTGPLHMAAALGIRALGLFPYEASMSPARWQPLGTQAEYLVTSSPRCGVKVCDNNNCACIRDIHVNQVQQRLLHWASQHE